MALINLKNIQRIFQVGDEEVHALRDVDLNIDRGEYLSLMGPSGSGKSTLLNMLGLLDRPSDGIYEFDGHDVTLLDDIAQARVRGGKIGFVFQFFHLIPRLTAFENVELPLMLGGVASATRRDRVLKSLNDMGLEDRVDHRPDQMGRSDDDWTGSTHSSVREIRSPVGHRHHRTNDRCHPNSAG